MKKNALIFILTVGTLIFSSQLSAQHNPVAVGFKAGTSLSNYRLKGNGSMKSHGVSIGLAYKF